MSLTYPFYLAENLAPAALSGDVRTFTELVERNFSVIMNSRNQTATVKWLRVAQLQAHITRAVFRAGGRPDELFVLSQRYLEKLSRFPVRERRGLREVLVEYSRVAMASLGSTRMRMSLCQQFLCLLKTPDTLALSVHSIAGVLGVTPSHLCRSIRRATGRSPIEHLQSTKLLHARERLASMSVTRAALDSGFGKASTFIVLFRRQYGTTPGSYKKYLSEKPPEISSSKRSPTYRGKFDIPAK